MREKVNLVCSKCLSRNYSSSRKKYDVTIDNELFKRYSGEINLVLTDLPNDERVNVIGYVDCSDIVVNSLKEKLCVLFITK